MTRKALVLTGGALKGAYQAGAICRLLEEGWEPDAIFGISVGSLNGALLVQCYYDNDRDWVAAGRALEQFWREDVRSPKAILTERSKLDLAARLVAGKWDGVYNLTPLKKLLAEKVKPETVRQFPLYVGAVALGTSACHYWPSNGPDFLSYVYASACEPMIMGPLHRGGWTYGGKTQEAWVDGGVRHIAPLGEAIAQRCTEIVVIACQPESLDVEVPDPGNIKWLLGRTVGILTNEVLANDLREVDLINTLVKNQSRYARDHGWVEIDATVIRPRLPLDAPISKFGPTHIAEMLRLGRADAADKVGQPETPPPGGAS